MSNSGLPEYISYLLRPDSYIPPATTVELKQTHISFVILTDRFAYKWKKNVDLGFLDFTTLDRRKYFCDEEIRLNCRLCREIYLERVHVSKSGQSFSLNGPVADCIEYGVKMRRLPQRKMMNEVIARGGLTRTDLQKLIDVLIPFYERADRPAGSASFGTVAAVRKNIYDNLEHIRPFVGGAAVSERQFGVIRDYVDSFLSREQLFVDRKNNGFVCDCHGDLHSGNICLGEKIYIFDCIEFSAELRITDIAADIAFLAMDLDYHGLSGLSGYFVERFIAMSGDSQLSDLLDFYKCYRAVVRCKIGLLTAADERLELSERTIALESSRRYLNLAEQYVAS